MELRISRRNFLVVGGLALSSAAMANAGAMAAAGAHAGLRRTPSGLLDTNVTLGRWPLRRLPLDETPRLVRKLRSLGIVQAWVGSYEGILHKDLAAANAWLATEAREAGKGFLIPFGTVNPTLPDWEEELRRCHEIHQMRGVRLYPVHHGYQLCDPVSVRLLESAAARQLLVQVVAGIEDERVRHRSLPLTAQNFSELPRLLQDCPRLRLLVLNSWRSIRGSMLSSLAATGRVFFDIATVEGVGGIVAFLKAAGPENVVFGSQAPFFYPEATILKLQESLLSSGEHRRLGSENARRLLSLD